MAAKKKHVKEKNKKKTDIGRQKRAGGGTQPEGNKSRNKLLGMAAVIAAFGIGSYNILSSTSLTIQDANPSSYIIAVMLMVFLLLVFSLKERLEFKPSARNMLFGILALAAYAIIASYLRILASFRFYIYRMDALLLPIFLAALIIIVFGTDGIRKLKHVIVYSAFASPLLLMPLLGMNNFFTTINAKFVFYMLRIMQIPVSSSGIMISLASNPVASIVIGQTCTDIGAFIALAAFLLPIAYLFDGKLKNKVLFVVIGIIGLAALNAARMLAIALSWFYYGISNALALFHASAGPVLFYAIIAIMIIFSYRLDLYVPKINRGEFAVSGKKSLLSMHVLLALVFGIFSLVLLSANANIGIQPTHFKNLQGLAGSQINASTETEILRVLNTHGINATMIGIVRLDNITGADIALNGNATAETNGAYAFVSMSKTILPINKSGRQYSRYAYAIGNGISVYSSILKTANYPLSISEFAAPINASGTYVPVDFLVFENYSSARFCSIGYRKIGLPNFFESEIYNLI
ncbi:MAG: exosortase/archaeosortase family protein, partial [Candidatus Marsarchaeota archaeon]|nr:exosortase/archaeosortase family protein [Candidatus Marsarchaeota archaeon]